MNISIIIPAYNEEDAVRYSLDKIVADGYHQKYEVIYINDGSTDKTGAIISEYPVKLINHLGNKGYGAALKTGIRKSSGDKIVILDSDGQHNPNQISSLIELLKDNDMVIGERTSGSFQVQNRKGGKRLIRWIGEYLLEQKLPDYNSGFRGFDRKLIQGMLHIMPNGFSFSTTSTMAFLKEGYNIATFPIEVAERVGRKSSVKFFKDGFKTIMLLFRIIMLFNPLKIFLPFSIFFSISGVAWGVAGYYLADRFPNTAIVILFLGMITFFIGLLADQIAILNRK